MKINTKRIVLAILLIINCSVIFYFSSQKADNSSAQSSRWVEVISEILPFVRNMQEPDKTILKEEILTPIVRKLAHISLYTSLGILIVNFILTFKKLKIYEVIVYSILLCIIYACSDEFHQTFIQGRSGEIRDVIIDTLGALIGVLVTILVIKILNRNIKENKLNNE